MIEANADFPALADRLATQALTLAEARIARRRTRQRWRQAALLWPLFVKG